MKVFFDECIPRPLRLLLPGHTIKTAQEMGWGRKKNGELIALAEAEFEVFLTSDKNLRYQQNLTGRKIALLVLSTNTWSVVRSGVVEIAAALKSLQPGEYREMAL